MANNSTRGVVGALAGVLGLSVVYFIGTSYEPGYATLQGDELGVRSGETREAYVSRAQQTLDVADGDHFALVTFAVPLTPQQAASVLEQIPRVNALVFAAAPPIALGEPEQTRQRAEVFANATDKVEGVVVYAATQSLTRLADAESVLAVEALPESAVWGTFGIHPVAPH